MKSVIEWPHELRQELDDAAPDALLVEFIQGVENRIETSVASNGRVTFELAVNGFISNCWAYFQKLEDGSFTIPKAGCNFYECD